MTALITLEHVSREFDGGRVVALSDVNLTIEKGQSVAVVGSSGSGKTTLIMLMCGIMAPSAGTIRWNGKPVTTPKEWTNLRRSEIGIVFQDFNLFPTLSANENVEVATFGTGIDNRERKRRAEAALEAVGLTARATHLPHQLSGGERQRVAIARSIVNRPTLILADEPTGNLDSVEWRCDHGPPIRLASDAKGDARARNPRRASRSPLRAADSHQGWPGDRTNSLRRREVAN